MRLANAAAATGGHVFKNTVAPYVHADISVFRSDFAPVAFQFFGQQLCQTGETTLTQFRAGDTDDDGIVWLYDDPVRDLGGVGGHGSHDR